MKRLKYIYFRFSKGDLTERRTFTGTIANTQTDSEIRIKSTGLVREKGRDLTHLYDKTPTPTEKSTKKRDNTKTPTKTLIAKRLRIDLGRSVGVTNATQLVWLNGFTGSQPSRLPQKMCNQKDTYLNICK